MNKKKLVELAEEVLTDIDADLEKELRKNLEKELCKRLDNRFHLAGSYIYGFQSNESYKKSYESVKPILDDAIDKLLNKAN
jgi:hypothetical protein